MVSETIASFFFVFMYMHSTDEQTQYSGDKVINCFIISSSFVTARLLGGGHIAAALAHWDSEAKKYVSYTKRGPMINPAIAIGQGLLTLDFNVWIYIVFPFAGMVLAYIFQE